MKIRYGYIHRRTEDGSCYAMAGRNGQIWSWSEDRLDASLFPEDVAERLIEECPTFAEFIFMVED